MAESTDTSESTGLETEKAGTQKADAHWSEAHEGITSNADVLAYAKKYSSEGEAVKAGYEITKKLGSSFRLPDDLGSLSQEQKTELQTKVRSLRAVPDSPEGYDIKRMDFPEELPYDESFELAFKNFAHQRGWENKDVQELADFYNSALVSAYEKHQETVKSAAEAAGRAFQLKCGTDYDKKTEGIERLRKLASDELGLGYLDDKTGEPRSKLDDCLNAISKENVVFGNMGPVLQLLSWIHEKFLAEGEPIEGAGAEAGATADFFKYDKVDK